MAAAVTTTAAETITCRRLAKKNSCACSKNEVNSSGCFSSLRVILWWRWVEGIEWLTARDQAHTKASKGAKGATARVGKSHLVLEVVGRHPLEYFGPFVARNASEILIG